MSKDEVGSGRRKIDPETKKTEKIDKEKATNPPVEKKEK